MAKKKSKIVESPFEKLITFGFGTLHDFLDYLGKCGHIRLEFGFIKSVEIEDLTIIALAMNPTSFSLMKKIRKLNQLGFSLRMKI